MGGCVVLLGASAIYCNIWYFFLMCYLMLAWSNCDRTISSRINMIKCALWRLYPNSPLPSKILSLPLFTNIYLQVKAYNGKLGHCFTIAK